MDTAAHRDAGFACPIGTGRNHVLTLFPSLARYLSTPPPPTMGDRLLAAALASVICVPRKCTDGLHRGRAGDALLR